MHSLSERPDTGFTLIEMAIVMVIIAVVAGGIVIGQAVIRSAELQAIMADVNRFRNAAKLFQDRYKYLPGDYPNAAEMWGTDAGCNSGNQDNTAANHVSKKATCGGNGDGVIGGYGGINWPNAETVGDSVAIREPLRAWQHLANAGLVEGLYSGASSDVTNGYEPGVNIPLGFQSRDNGFNMFQAYRISPGGTDPGGFAIPGVYPGKYGHIIAYGRAKGVPTKQGLPRPALRATDAKTIDDKLDDGRPGTGSVISFTPGSAYSPNCTTTANPVDAMYRTEQAGVVCALVFLTGL
ncbi:MAG: type II secretion system GspH family protein [Phycisphaerae bacterium]|nr:type II secretion system GspH family protein [Phycisphaerae bacterium]